MGINHADPKLGTIEPVDKDVDRPNRIVLADPVFQAFRKQRALTAIRPLNEAPHRILPQIARESYRENQIQQHVFTQPGSNASDRHAARPRGMSASTPIASKRLHRSEMTRRAIERTRLRGSARCAMAGASGANRLTSRAG